MKRPSVRAQTTLFNLISNTESLAAEESEWIRHSPDLVSLVRDAEHGWFGGFLEDTLNTVSRTLTRISSILTLSRGRPPKPSRYRTFRHSRKQFLAFTLRLRDILLSSHVTDTQRRRRFSETPNKPAKPAQKSFNF